MAEKMFERILVGIDFSDFSQEALRISSGLAKSFANTVFIVHVFESPGEIDPAVMIGDSRAIRALLDLQKKSMESALKNLNTWVEKYDWGNATLAVKVEPGTAHNLLIEMAKESDIDLIVIGAHGRSGFRQMFIGTTTERVVRKSSCPVLAVTAPNQQRP